MEFYKVIEHMMGEGKKMESLELVRHILYDLAYVSLNHVYLLKNYRRLLGGVTPIVFLKKLA